jgi:hypothetical protein
MSSIPYATRNNVLALVPHTLLSRPARAVEGIDPSADVLQLAQFALDANAPCMFSASGNGVLPSPLAPFTIYYALTVALADTTTDENRFQVSATSGGSAIDLTDAGAAPFSLVIPAGPTIDAQIDKFSRWVDSVVTGDAVPLVQPIPSWITAIVSLRSAIGSAHAFGRSVPVLEQDEDKEIADFLRMAKNLPLRGDAAAQLSANTAVVQSTGRLAFRGRLP